MSKVTTPPVVDKKKDDSQKICCPDFSPRIASFDEKEIIWKDKAFIKDSTWCFFYIPLNFGGATTRACGKIEAAGAAVPDEDFVMLSDMTSRWNTNIFFSVAKDDVPGAEMVHLSGTFLTKVFEGPYSQFDTWIKEMKEYVKKIKGDQVDNVDDYANWYQYYTTCPKCAKKYGKNYTVLFVKVA
mmetsp:Transcript_12890/g.24787  ORF Transcript_12890/g.24787 Transcript_12890/m.24787 type:complete len:184 (+) Transcript_12890:107-658(+)